MILYIVSGYKEYAKKWFINIKSLSKNWLFKFYLKEIIQIFPKNKTLRKKYKNDFKVFVKRKIEILSCDLKKSFFFLTILFHFHKNIFSERGGGGG